MKKIFTSTIAAVICAAMTTAVVSADGFTWNGFRGNANNNGIVSEKTPKSADGSALYWAEKVGTDWTDAPSSITIVDDEIVFLSGNKIYKMNKETGKISEKTGSPAAGTSYSIIPPCYADGVIYAGLAGGTIQAFDAETLESLWVYTDPLGGQPNSPITYFDGHIYTGFWNSETTDANYVCIDVADEDPNNTVEAKKADWTYTNKGGFYWAGSYASENFVAVGTDDGENNSNTASGKLVTFDTATGEKLDEISDIYGDVRSSIVYDEESDSYYFTTKGGVFYKVKIDENGHFTDRSEIILNGTNDKTTNQRMSTTSPCISNGRAYIGVSGSSAWGKYTGSGIMVIDLDTMSIAYTAETMAYCQASGLLSTGYTDEDGYNYVYFIENTDPSEVRYIKDKKGVTEVIDPSVETYNGVKHNCAPILFTPVGAQSNYAISSFICDDEGTLYFKNDSCYIMALGSKIESISAKGKTVYKEGDVVSADNVTVTAVLSNGENRDVTSITKFPKTPLTKDDFSVSLICDYAMYGDSDTVDGHKTGVETDAVDTTLDIKVLDEADYNAVNNVIELIDAIGDVTLDSKDSISAARKAYDALSQDLKEDVSNYDILTQAEKKYAQLLNESSSKNENSSGNGNSSDNGNSDISKSNNNSSKSDKNTNNQASANPATGAKGAALTAVAVLGGAIAVIRRKKN